MNCGQVQGFCFFFVALPEALNKRSIRLSSDEAGVGRNGDETHSPDPELRMMVSLPADAASTICRSTDLLILALKDYIKSRHQHSKTPCMG